MNKRQTVPETIKFAMAMWRKGHLPFPKSYIDFHVGLAKQNIAYLEEEYGFQILKTSLIDDGWLDGMKTTEHIIETQTGGLLRLKWDDSSQKFMKRGHKEVGWSGLNRFDLT